MIVSRLNQTYPWVSYDLRDFDNIRPYAGWYKIMDRLLSAIAKRYEEQGIPLNEHTFYLRQVKEKFAGLRVYLSAKVDTEDLRRAAEEESLRTCMRCGSPGEVVVTSCWYHTVCPYHMTEEDMTPEEFMKRMEAYREDLVKRAKGEKKDA